MHPHEELEMSYNAAKKRAAKKRAAKRKSVKETSKKLEEVIFHILYCYSIVKELILLANCMYYRELCTRDPRSHNSV